MPFTYSDEQVAEYKRLVLDLVSGGLSLRKACAELKAERPGEHVPTEHAIRIWAIRDEQFGSQYARAREHRADARSDRIDDVIDDVKAGSLDPQAARVIIDAEKWQAGKENHKRYGDKFSFDGDVGFKASDQQLESRLAHLLGKAGVAVPSRGEGETEAPA
jgi:hypothetical protein